MKKKLPKQKSIPKLVKELDTIFSQYVRLKNADDNGMVKCFISGVPYHWKSIQAGHFQSRRYYAIRWDEVNVQPQSVSSNVFNQGEQYQFGENLKKKYGQEAVDILMYKKNNPFKLDRFVLSWLIVQYKEKVEQIKSSKGI